VIDNNGVPEIKRIKCSLRNNSAER